MQVSILLRYAKGRYPPQNPQSLNFVSPSSSFAGITKLNTYFSPSICRASTNKPSQPSLNDTILRGASLSLATLPTLPFAAMAEDTDAAAAVSSAVDAAATATGKDPLTYLFYVAPLLIYGTFYIYREKFNPRAKLGDLLYITAALVIFGNIFSILVFKVRFF